MSVADSFMYMSKSGVYLVLKAYLSMPGIDAALLRKALWIVIKDNLVHDKPETACIYVSREVIYDLSMFLLFDANSQTLSRFRSAMVSLLTSLEKVD